LKKIISVVGARPNFMKVAPIHKSFLSYNGHVDHRICHTGQHYDENMSKIFFDDLELPHPDFYLGVGSGSHSVQTAKIMIEFEKVLLAEKPDMIIVVGDVNSTIACSLVASKLGVKVIHVEAGLRSFDRTMPEEINRILTDAISDYLFVTEPSGVRNLEKEGAPFSKVFHVGNVMIDSLVTYLPKTERSEIYSTLGVEKNRYILVTLHRPSNVDSEGFLRKLVLVLNSLSERMHVVFPVHPRTQKNMEQLKLDVQLSENVLMTEPTGYIDFLALTKDSALIITDSGGIQEESTFLGVQCITVRENTERPVTVELGTNHLVGTDLDAVQRTAGLVLDGHKKLGKIPELWDGKAAERITEILCAHIDSY
jgi:UDP-N-acetylglucosamine 2-epimerase (non-hydrolysing)